MGIPLQVVRFTALLGLLACVSPVHAIVTAGSDPNANIIGYGGSFGGVDLSGVVEITSSIGGCTGSLLTGGLSILTAAHCITGGAYGSPIATGITVYFQGPSGMVSGTVANVTVNPGYTGDATQGNDLAVLTLTTPAPAYATGYQLYSNTAVPGTSIVMAGYGLGGTGDTGAVLPFGTLRAGENKFFGTADEFFFGWSSDLFVGQLFKPCQAQIQATCSTNALQVGNPFSSPNQVSSAHGDSGGPAFFNGMLVGVTDLGVCWVVSETNSNCATPPSVNTLNNSYFGEMFAYTSVAANLGFIQGAMVQIATPEPGTIVLLLSGLAAAGRIRRKSKQT